MTDFGCALFSALGGLFLIGVVLLIRVARRYERGRIDYVAKLNGWSLESGNVPGSWIAKGEQAGVAWEMRGRPSARRRFAQTEWRTKRATGDVTVFAGPRPPAFLEGALTAFKGKLLEGIGANEADAAAAEFIEMPTDTLLVATNQADAARAWLEGLEGEVALLRPRIVRYRDEIRVGLGQEARDAKTAEALVALGVALAKRAGET
ncbi:MAG: hypothetical protein AAGE52_08760 [Myxococcota bacterium]